MLMKLQADVAHHVIGCRFTQETRVQNVFDDVAHTAHQSLERGVFREVEGAAAVARELAAALGVPAPSPSEVVIEAFDMDGAPDADMAMLATVLVSLSAAAFAEFGTSRSKFQVDGANIDVDAASFGRE